VVRPYQAAYSDPIVVKAGEVLIVGSEDVEYPGWIWCTDERGKSGWVPKDCIRCKCGSCKAVYDYTAIELSAQENEELTVNAEKYGWFLCTNGDGQSGWLPVANVNVI